MRWGSLLMVGLVGCAEAIDVSGDWHEDWSCEESCGGGPAQTITGSVDMTLTQAGDQVTRTDDDGTTWEGTIAGRVLTLSTGSGDATEESTFTFDASGEGFTVASTYLAGDCSGTCTGTGTRR